MRRLSLSPAASVPPSSSPWAFPARWKCASPEIAPDQALPLCREAVQLAVDFGPACIANALTGVAAPSPLREGKLNLPARLRARRRRCVSGWVGNMAGNLFMHHRILSAVTRAALDDSAWTAAWDDGRALSLDEATAEALAVTAGDSPPHGPNPCP